ncbi:bacterial regulatory, gntR family protein (plasmid) [Ochrobactrum quorumnocens]|uniref:Bacterial regulatory, gntR family protein n=1 Tax=Ochrobactrum quorumnocens TaxID=271865 RepID=A0A248UMY9_9HYPH|nr:GntR family transcriptional regulator [[Ochrobactrum] quorumnocens]ASV88048.1 bacterial regulatory, gntR family protein [[Ochrobactrum] quorumnocens]
MGNEEIILADEGYVQTYKTLVQDTLNEQIYQQIKEKLIVGEFRPGDRLVLRNLAAALGTSVVPVRDALQKLESLGALRLERTFFVPRLTIGELTEIRDIRVALEGLSAARAACTSTPESLAGLRVHFDAMTEAARGNDTSGFLRANARFHLHIADMSNSPILRDMIEPLWLRMGPSVRLAKAEPGKLINAIPDHEIAFAAIASKDAAAACNAIVADVVNCFGILADASRNTGK